MTDKYDCVCSTMSCDCREDKMLKEIKRLRTKVALLERKVKDFKDGAEVEANEADALRKQLSKKPKVVKRPTTCQSCWGAGYVSVYHPDGEGGGMTCNACSGTGGSETKFEVCPTCKHLSVHLSAATKKYLAGLRKKK